MDYPTNVSFSTPFEALMCRRSDTGGISVVQLDLSVDVRLASVHRGQPPHAHVQARWLTSSESTVDILGYEVNELRTHSFFQLVHPEEVHAARSNHMCVVRYSFLSTVDDGRPAAPSKETSLPSSSSSV